MRYLSLILIMLAVLVAPMANAAGDGRNFGVLAPTDWDPSTPETDEVVSVEAWFSENGVEITDGRFIGPLLPGELRDVDASVFIGSGRTITFNAFAERVPRMQGTDGQFDTRVMAVPVTQTFPEVAPAPPLRTHAAHPLSA